jgi:hypothetical protein
MRIVAIITLLPIHITGSQVKPLEFYCGPSWPAGGGEGITLIDIVTLIVVTLVAPWDPEMQFLICTVVFYRDVWVTASNLRFLKRYLRGRIVKMNSIVITRCCCAGDLGRHWVLRQLNLKLDCRKSVLIHPLSVAPR